MLPIVAERREVARITQTVHRDPAPSRTQYRLQRLWLTQWFRRFVRFWLPLGAVVVTGYLLASNASVQAWGARQYETVRASIAQRPELTIRSISIPVGSNDLRNQIAGVIDIDLPVSALDTDLAAIRDLVQSLSAVKSATVRTRTDGVLDITIVERIPEMVWRLGNRLYLLDETGVRVAEVPRRSTRADLPLILGVGAQNAIEEAQELFSIAAPIHDRILGLVRVGERRWDLVLDRNQAIMLPATGARDALLKALALNVRDDLLARDLSIVDLRDANRPILRLNDDALHELRRLRAVVQGEPV